MANINTHPLYKLWNGMKRRCSNERARQYCDYGGRGITVCDRWQKSFQDFVTDMGPRPQGWTIERVDNNAGYSPENCRWATRAEQLLNKRNNIRVTVEGREYLAHTLAKRCGLDPRTIAKRAARGLSLAAVLDPKWRGNPDGARIGAASSATKRRSATHCKRGHPLSGENLRLAPAGMRVCRECSRIRDRKYYAQRQGMPPCEPLHSEASGR